MLNCIRNNQFVIVVLDCGVILQSAYCTDEMFDSITNAVCDDEIVTIFNPILKEKQEELVATKKVLMNVENSSLLTQVGDSIYWKELSELSMPIELVNKVLEAESNNDTNLITTYSNFWTLMSLNPDPLCRQNLFKWILKWDMVVGKSGLILGYRNVCTTEEEGVFTDEHTHTMHIELGKMVTMPRDECDSDSHISCSRGLHIGGTSWLTKGYCGNTGLACLINPVDIVAVPFDNADYGKLRCCAYFPMAKVEFDSDNKIVPYYSKDGFEADYVKKILYDGITATEDSPEYKIICPEIPELTKETVTDKVMNIARTFMK